MSLEVKITADGSNTLYNSLIDENYHSIHGAIQESQHVFIEAGLKNAKGKKLCVFEMGLGTGLNTLLSFIYSKKNGLKIDYHAIEKYPLEKKEYTILNYPRLLGNEHQEIFDNIHASDWEKPVTLASDFTLKKYRADIKQFNFDHLPQINVIYFDAFAPEKQAEMWTSSIFRKIYERCAPSAILVTYCAKGQVRRDLQAAGFKVERIPGPKGKREMLRAIKPQDN